MADIDILTKAIKNGTTGIVKAGNKNWYLYHGISVNKSLYERFIKQGVTK